MSSFWIWILPSAGSSPYKCRRLHTSPPVRQPDVSANPLEPGWPVFSWLPLLCSDDNLPAYTLEILGCPLQVMCVVRCCGPTCRGGHRRVYILPVAPDSSYHPHDPINTSLSISDRLVYSLIQPAQKSSEGYQVYIWALGLDLFSGTYYIPILSSRRGCLHHRGMFQPHYLGCSSIRSEDGERMGPGGCRRWVLLLLAGWGGVGGALC